MDYTNKHILDRMQHYGVGNREACTELLGTVTLCILDILDHMEKGDCLRIRNLGGLSIQLEPQVWRFVPMLKGRMRFRRSRPKRWLFVFEPHHLIKHEMPTRWPDEVHPPFVERTTADSTTPASTATEGPAKDEV